MSWLNYKHDNYSTRASVQACSIRTARSRACPMIGPNRPPPLHLQYDVVSQKNKKHSDISFPYCRTHAIDAGASTAPPTRRWPSPTWRPSGSNAACQLRLAAAVRLSRAARSCPSHSPILRRSLLPVMRATRPADPSLVLLAMVVVVVLTRCRFRPQWLELSSPKLLHVASVCFKYFKCSVGMFQLSSVPCGCCKSSLGCCICCNDGTRMLQMSVPIVSFVFFYVYCKCVYLDVAYISHICCKCSI
jgi:hypothetical protein